MNNTVTLLLMRLNLKKRGYVVRFTEVRLLPLSCLLRIYCIPLTLAEKRHKLTPVFTGADVLHYYPLFSAMLTSDAIVVHVPFLSQNVYNIHRIEAFPFAVNDSLLTIDLPDSIVLTNQGLTLYSTMTYEDLSECKSEQAGVYFCAATLFAFVPVKEDGVCEVTLTQIDASRCVSLCPYKHVVSKPFFHKSFMGHHYFFLTRTMSVTVTCAKGSVHSRVTGHFAILKQGTLHSASVTIHPETLHEGFVSSIFMSLHYYLSISIQYLF